MPRKAKSLPNFDGNLSVMGVLHGDPYVFSRKDGSGIIANIYIKISAIVSRGSPIIIPFVVFDNNLATIVAEEFRAGDRIMITKSYPVSDRSAGFKTKEIRIKFAIRELVMPESKYVFSIDEIEEEQ